MTGTRPALSRPRARRPVLAALFFVALCATLLHAESSARTNAPQALHTNARGQEQERLARWPKLDSSQAAAAKTEIARLRKDRTETMGEDAARRLIELGAGTCPGLLAALGHEKDEKIRASLTAVLDALTGPEHTRLLAKAFTDRSPALQMYALRRVARFPDAGTRAAAEKALARVSRVKRGKTPDPELVLAASLACASAGSREGLEALFEEARVHWSTEGEALRIAFGSLRAPEMTAQLIGQLDAKERPVRLAALRLLGAAGVAPEAVAAVAPFLDSSDSGLRSAAINSLRGIVDGKPPLDHLSAFEAIEKAKAWKERVR